MLTIEVRINEHLIAKARAVNVSDLAPVSNYAVIATSEASTLTGAQKMELHFDVNGHPRLQSAWALVRRIAEQAIALETQIVKPE